jgi:hypothetical protein
MTSGISDTDMATPAAPSAALQTLKPWRCSRLVNMSRFAKLSSTINIFLAGNAKWVSVGIPLILFLPGTMLAMAGHDQPLPGRADGAIDRVRRVPHWQTDSFDENRLLP